MITSLVYQKYLPYAIVQIHAFYALLTKQSFVFIPVIHKQLIPNYVDNVHNFVYNSIFRHFLIPDSG